MAIKITDNFQVNIKNPIDNRFVVGSQSIPGGPGTIYPTPFYAYRDDISSNIGFVYPGLRIWDFNDNLPYVWTGTTWSNENLTGASVLGSGTPAFSAGGGYQNYITKFYDTSTVLTKSLLFDNYDHVGLAIPGVINPNSTTGIGSGVLMQSTLNVSASGLTQGLHVNGRIKTNKGFVGYGGYIGSINAGNIDAGPLNTGTLNLQLISKSNFPNTSPDCIPTVPTPTTYLLTNDNGGSHQWRPVLSVVPFWQPTNLPAINLGPDTTSANLYSGNDNTNQLYQFFSLVSTGLAITDGLVGGGSIRIETKAGVNVGSTDGIELYKGLNANNIHQFRKIKSNSLKVSIDPNDNLLIESPAAGSSRALYINKTYTPTFDDWKRASDLNQLTTISYIHGAGYYRGDGTQARPFTESIKYDLNGTLIDTKFDTAIQNGLDFYINEFGAVPINPGNGQPTSKGNPSRGGELLTIQGSGETYFFGGDFNIIYLKLSIQAANVISTTTGFLIDLDDTSIFPQSSTAWINITIEKDCQLEIRGNLVPDNGYLGGVGVLWPVSGGIQRNGGRGFRCSGTDLSTTNYSNNLHQIVFRGDGQITSLYQPKVGSSGPYGPDRAQNDNLFLFNLDENNNKTSLNPEWTPTPANGNTTGPTPVIGYNNDGHICIQIECNVYTRFQGIFMIGGKSKIEFTKNVGMGSLTDDVYGSGTLPNGGLNLNDNDCFYAKGGLIRFFDARISVASGKRKSCFIVEPDLNKQSWSPRDQNGVITGGDLYLSILYSYGTIKGAIPNLIFRNCRLGGPSVTLFDKRTSGVATVDMLNCTSLYFASDNIVKTSTTGAPGGGENWNGPTDQRWGCQWNPSQGWDTSVQAIKPNPIRDARKYNGSFTFKNNILEFTRINTNLVDLTLANGQSAMNTLGSQVVTTLQRFSSVSEAVSPGFQLQKGSQFLNYGATPAGLVAGKNYYITNPGPAASFNANWYTKGYSLADLGTPAAGKMFNCTTAGSFTPSGTTASAREIKIDFVP